MQRLHAGGAERAGGLISAHITEATADLLHIGGGDAVEAHRAVVAPLIKELTRRSLGVLPLIGGAGAHEAVAAIGISADRVAALLPRAAALPCVPIAAPMSAEPRRLTQLLRDLRAAALIGAAGIGRRWITGGLADGEVADQAGGAALRPPLAVYTGLPRLALRGGGAEGGVAHQVTVGVDRIGAGLIQGAAVPRLTAADVDAKADEVSAEEAWAASLGAEAGVTGVSREICVGGVYAPLISRGERGAVWERALIWARREIGPWGHIEGAAVQERQASPI